MNLKTYRGLWAVLRSNALSAETAAADQEQVSSGFRSPKSMRLRNRLEWRTSSKRSNESSPGVLEPVLVWSNTVMAIAFFLTRKHEGVRSIPPVQTNAEPGRFGQKI